MKRAKIIVFLLVGRLQFSVHALNLSSLAWKLAAQKSGSINERNKRETRKGISCQRIHIQNTMI